MTPRRWGGGLRRRLLVAVVLAVGAALVAVIAGFNTLLAIRNDADATAVLRARGAAELATLDVVDGRLRLREAPDDAAVDSQVWVYADRHALERPRAGPGLERAADALATSPAGTRRDVPEAQARLLSTPVDRGGRRLGTIVTGISLAPYHGSARTALIASVGVGLVLLLASALAARWLLGAALRPVAQMTAQAEDWSEHDPDRRFALGPPHDELTRLAATLDRLLDRLRASLRHEQRFSAELSHELRTPLAKISAETELALRHDRDAPAYRDALARVDRAAGQMARTLDTLLAGARLEIDGARGTADAATAARDAVEGCSALARDRGVAIDLSSPTTSVRVGAPADVVERILAPLLENGCRYAAHRVSVHVGVGPGGVGFTVADDGPGIAAGEEQRIFEPGVRGEAADGDGEGAGLGLALARRLARAAGGEVHAESGGSGGRVVVSLPAA